MVRYFQLIAALLAAVLIPATRASDSAEFVMLIDLSSRMAARQEATAQTVRDLAVTGIHGRMQEGHTLTIWFYDTAFSTNMPPLVWDSRNAQDFAARAEASFKAKKFLRTPRPKGPTLQPVVTRRTEYFTTLVLTDGYLPVSGTPFDEQINLTLVENRDRFAREKKPFLVTLLAHNGEWAAFGVHTNLGSAVELPVVATNSPAMEQALAVLRGAITNVVKEPKPAPIVAVVEKPAPKPTPPPPKIETPPIKVAEKPREEPPPIVIEKPPDPPVTKTVVEPPPAEPPRVEAAIPKPQTPSPVAAVISPTQPSFPWPLFLAGFGVVAALGALIYMRFSQLQPSRGSLISQSFDAEREVKRRREP
jgi:hypothetical protein